MGNIHKMKYLQPERTKLYHFLKMNAAIGNHIKQIMLVSERWILYILFYSCSLNCINTWVYNMKLTTKNLAEGVMENGGKEEE